MSIVLEELIQQVKALPPEAQQRVRAALDQSTPPASGSPATEEDFQRRLVETGMLDEMKRPKRDQAAFDRFQPIHISGRPLSEDIIEDRR